MKQKTIIFLMFFLLCGCTTITINSEKVKEINKKTKRLIFIIGVDKKIEYVHDYYENVLYEYFSDKNIETKILKLSYDSDNLGFQDDKNSYQKEITDFSPDAIIQISLNQRTTYKYRNAISLADEYSDRYEVKLIEIPTMDIIWGATLNYKTTGRYSQSNIKYIVNLIFEKMKKNQVNIF